MWSDNFKWLIFAVLKSTPSKKWKIQIYDSKTYPIACANTLYDITDFVVDRLVRNIKDWCLKNGGRIYHKIKKLSNCSSETIFSEVNIFQRR